METAILSIIGYLLPFILEGVRSWWEAKQAAEADTYENNTEKFDQALGGRDAAGMSVLFDRLSAPPGDGDPGGQGDKKPA